MSAHLLIRSDHSRRRVLLDIPDHRHLLLLAITEATHASCGWHESEVLGGRMSACRQQSQREGRLSELMAQWIDHDGLECILVQSSVPGQPTDIVILRIDERGKHARQYRHLT